MGESDPLILSDPHLDHRSGSAIGILLQSRAGLRRFSTPNFRGRLPPFESYFSKSLDAGLDLNNNDDNKNGNWRNKIITNVAAFSKRCQMGKEEPLSF